MTEPLSQEPQGFGHELLTEWGQWFRDDGDGRASWAVKPRVDRGFHGEPPDRVRFVDKVIAHHKISHKAHWSVISRYYLSDLSEWQIAKGMGWDRTRVNTVLLTVCGLVESRWNAEWLDFPRGK